MMAKWHLRSSGKFPPSAVEEIAVLVNRVRDLDGLLASCKNRPPSSSLDAVLRPIAKDSDIPLSDVRKLFNALENIRLFYEDYGSFDRVFRRLKRGVEQDLAEKLSHVESEIRLAAETYMLDNSVMLSYKASKLIFQRERLYQETEIITDVRPVFNSAADEVKEIVVSHEMIVTFYEESEFKKLFVSMDNTDIVSLRKACDRALLKAKTLKETMKGPWETEVLNDEADAVD